MTQPRGKKRNKFAYSNKFLEATARHLTKTQACLWLALWNYAFDEEGKLVVEISLRHLAPRLGMRREKACTERGRLVKLGLLRPAGTGPNRVSRFEIYPVVAPTTPTAR